MKKCQVEMMKMRCRGKVGGMRGKPDFLYALRKFRKYCENFATIAKILQSQRNFRYAHFFAKLAKVTVHSENLNFAMPCIFAMIAKFRYHSEIHCIAKIIPLCFLFQTTSFCLITILSLL